MSEEHPPRRAGFGSALRARGRGSRRRRGPRLALEDLPAEVAAAIEASVTGERILLVRAGHVIGSLEFRSSVLEGDVVERSGPAPSPPSPPSAPPQDGVTVVATAMRLSDAARRRLSDELGSDYVVLDLAEAPSSADVLLTHPVSPQLLGILGHQFPAARVVITEIEDEELGVRYAGPVSRLLDAGASAYLPPRPIAELAANVHAYLSQSSAPMLAAADVTPRTLPAPVDVEP